MITRQELFTDKLAREFVGYDPPPIFFSDIRSTDWGIESEKKVEEQCRCDMDAQMRWHQIIKPDCSMLKFRLSWNPGKTKYLDGEIYVQPWTPITSSETRLWTKPGGDMSTRDYDNQVYENECFYYNTVRRVARYPHDVMGEGIDHCYDCTAEVSILTRYLKDWCGMTNQEEINKEVSKMSYDISRACKGSTLRTLATGNLDPGKRKQVIAKRQWINNMPAYTHAKIQLKHKEEAETKTMEERYSKAAVQMMKSQGYVEGKGLGAKNAGIAHPVQAEGNFGQRGIGYNVHRFKNSADSETRKSSGEEAKNSVDEEEACDSKDSDNVVGFVESGAMTDTADKTYVEES